MNLLSPISSIMTTNPITLRPSNTIGEALLVLDKYKIHHLPITIDQVLLGIVSSTDLLLYKRGFLKKEGVKTEEIRLNNVAIKEVMTQGVSTMAIKETIHVALDIFKENIFHAIPIVENGKLVGIVTTHDIIHHLANDREAYAEYD